MKDKIDKNKGNTAFENLGNDENKKAVRRVGTMNTAKYEMELRPRTEDTPNPIGIDNTVMQIAKGMGRKTFDNPQQLADSLQGFEQWCLNKNITPSYVGLAVYLHISKSTLLKYMKDTTEYTVFSIRDNNTKDIVYSTYDKQLLDKYINTHYIVEDDSNSSIIYNKDNIGSCSSKNKATSIKDIIDSGKYSIVNSCVSFADVLASEHSLIELCIINRTWTLKNPAFGMYLLNNKSGGVEQYSNTQSIAISTKNPLDEMSNEDILKAANERPTEE